MLGFYAKHAGNQIRPRDRETYQEVAALPEAAIQYGIMQSVVGCKTRVNSFAYCVPAILDAHAEGVSADLVEYMKRTFSARREMIGKPYDAAAFDRLRHAAQGQQPSLPGSGAGDLVELPPKEK